MKFDFFRGNECEQYLFYRVPQVLFTDDEFRYISSEAKLLYGFLLDRKISGLMRTAKSMCISRKTKPKKSSTLEQARLLRYSASLMK